jgi:hypothetical protein
LTWKHIRTRVARSKPAPVTGVTLRADLRSGSAAGWLARDQSGRIRAAARESAQSLHSGQFLYTRPERPALFPGRFRGSIVKKKESADKPGSVEDNHSSGIRVAAYLKRPTREHVWATRAASSEDEAACSPIWSCSRRGLPCHRVLPPARCALTAPFHPYRPLCRGVGGLLSVALSVGSRPPGVTWRRALGARTFLHACAQRLSGRLRGGF